MSRPPAAAAGGRAARDVAPHLPPSAEALRRLCARGCLPAHAARPRHAIRAEARTRG